MGSEVWAIRSLLGRSLTIDERLEHEISGSTTSGHGAAEARFGRWQEIFLGKEDLFLNRLLSAGSGICTAFQIAGDRSPTQTDSLPAWASNAEWIVRALTEDCELQDRPTNRSRPPLPFEEAFSALIENASSRAGIRSTPSPMTSSGVRSIEMILLARITRLFARCLFEGFVLYRKFVPKPNGALEGDSVLYTRYIKGLQRGEILDVLEARPVLLRLLCIVVSQWIDSTNEFASRLASDINGLSDRFSKDVALGGVINVTAALSDHHNGGREVMRVKFESGVEVCYKPKELELDIAAQGFLDWLQKNGAPNSFAVAKTWACNGYGWVQWIHHRPCRSIDEANAFFLRSGATLCLLQILGGTDFHAENIVADADVPVLIDLETLFHPWTHLPVSDQIPQTEGGAAYDALRASVHATHYLRIWIVRPDGASVTAGGLDSFRASSGNYEPPFDNINTDAMQPRESPREQHLCPNLPRLNGDQCSAAAFGERIVEGYSEMYRFLMERKYLLCDSVNGPLRAFATCRTRVILRPTMLYGMLLDQSMREDTQGNGFRWSERFERLALSWPARSPQRKSKWRLLCAERVALAHLDIPSFSTVTNSKSLFLPNGDVIEDYFKEPSYALQVGRVRRMCSRDLSCQVSFIRNVFGSASAPFASVSGGVEEQEEKLTSDQAHSVACVIAGLVADVAIRYNGVAEWLGRVSLSKAGDASSLEVAGHGLYGGGTGIALFLAALFSATGDDCWRSLALDALRAVPSRQDKRAELADAIGIGGGTGVGSIVYALTRCSRFLGDSNLLDLAVALSRTISQCRIDRDRDLDVIAGAAGAILGLLALHQETHDDATLDCAVRCGEHLVRTQRPALSGAAWFTRAGSVIPGMAHGASGIAIALLRLYKVTQTASFRDSAQKAFAFEASAYDPSSGNWPVSFLPNAPSAQPVQWCHGASGIGLARLEALDILSGSVIEADLSAALQTTLGASESENDDLCCGNLGRIELLIAAGLRLREISLALEGYRRTMTIVRRAVQTGHFRLRHGAALENPGLHTGLSGIGYQLLRISNPQGFPSVLLWE